MKDYASYNAPLSLSVSRFTSGSSDKAGSDSGISSRGSSSGSSDERSGSRSSALSGLDENLPSSHHQPPPQQQQPPYLHHHHLQQHHQGPPPSSRDKSPPTAIGVSGAHSVIAAAAAADRYYLHHPASLPGHHPPPGAVLPLDAVRLWRDHPLSLSLIGDPTIRHVDSVQHQPLLMSHPAVGVGSSPSSSASVAAVSPPSVATAPSTPSAHYPPPSAVPSMITPSPLPHQLPPHLYAQMPEMLWKQPRFPAGLTASQLHSMQDEIMERERAYALDRDRQERQDRQLREQEREVEKQKEREKQRERDKLEKDRLEKQRAEQAVIEHFSKAQTLGYKKSSGWNFLPTSSAPNSNSFRMNDDERKRIIEQEQQRMIRSDMREREKMTGLPAFTPYAPHNLQMPKSTTATPVPSNSGSTPPNAGGSTAAVIQNRVKSQMSLPKTESPYSVYGYSPFSSSPHLNLYQTEKMMKNSVAMNSIVPNKSSSAMDRELLMSAHVHGVQPVDMKNSVIVKNDGKGHAQMTPAHLLPAADMVLKSGGGSLVAGTAAPSVHPSHSPNLKSRGEPTQQHYLLQPPSVVGKPPYDYRSPNQSPHISNATSPHQLLVEPIKMHHRPSSSPAGVSPGGHHRQSPLPLTQSRQSPQTHHRQSPQTHHRQSPLPANQPPVQLAPPHQRHSPHLSSSSSRTGSPPEQRYVSVASPNAAALYQKAPIPHPAAGVSSAAYVYPSSLSSVTSMATPVKPKVSSPAPAQFYGKPTSGISTGTPVCRPQEVSINAVPMNTKVLITPSPYQQLSQHQPPPSTIVSTHQNLDPPPAHSSRLTSVVSDPLSFFGGASGTGGPALQRHTGAADLTASAAAAVAASCAETTVTAVPPAATAASPSQMQPLDLGVKESTAIGSVAPTELVKRKLGGEEDESSDQPATKRLLVDVVPEVSVVPPTPTPSTTPPADDATDANPLVAAIASAAPATVEPPPPSLTPVLPEETSVVAPPPPCSSPSTPAKLAPSSVDGEKSNSPKPPSYGGHKLKKAWLQRHSGEDVGDEKALGAASATKSLDGSLSINENDGNVPTSGGGNADRAVTGSPLSSSVTKEAAADSAASNPLTSLNNSLNSIGSMAVNSISKVKQPKGGAAGKKGGAKDSRASPLVPNGHLSPKVSGGTNSDESSSTDTDTKASPKRVPPKLKRKKHGTPRKTSAAAAAAAGAADTTPKRKKLNSTSSTDSDKESASEKDSEDNSTAATGGKKTVSGNGGDEKKDNSRKRGRKPKMPSDGYATGNGNAGGAAGGGASSNGNGGQKDDEPPKEKKMREDPREQKDPFLKPSVSQLKRTGESFLQDGPCFEVAPKLAKCRECRWTQNQRSKSNSNIFCRFYAFRRLRYTKNGQLAIAGFSDPYRDAKHDDLNLWLPNTKNPPTDLDLEVARFTLLQVGDQFCDLLMQEADAININLSDDKKIAWKRVVQGVREMCDVCETTLFNFHWACSKCGFVVCIDCYKGRKNGTVKIWGESGKDRDDLSWLLCTNRQPHEQEKLMLTQIIAGDALMKLLKSSHDTRAMWDMALNCGCPLAATPKPTNEICKMIMRNLKQEKMKKAEQVNGQPKTENGTEESAKNETDSPLNWLADVALNQNKSSADDDGDSSDDSEEGSFSTLRELLIRPASKTNGNNSRPSSPNSSASAATTSATATSTTATTSSTSSSTTSTSTTVAVAANKSKSKKSTLDSFNEMLSSVGGECHDDNGDEFIDDRFANNGDGVALKYFVRDHMRKQYRSQGHCPIRIMTLSESKLLYPDVPHSWLCDGKLLRLLDAIHPGNYTIFQDQWRRGQPVIVSEVSKRLNLDLWHPDSFIRDFGDVKNDLINCMTGKVVPNQPMRKFWEGFEFLSRRLKDDKGTDMLLKLKDWPPGEDFAEMLPSRFNDLMSVLPLSEYTQRNGRLNLASRLPECFVRPDLGPKMYNAYGSAMHPNKGTTNLHLDISDAVNVMVYVGIPKDGDNEEHIKEAYRAIDEAGCDILTRRRVREKGELPGALWHIYAARDADKIRDLLNKVAIERGDRLEPNHDPIHDQSCYLDGPLRERLFKEYAVEGYAIVQCMGDAVFVPAGAPHQVRNLHNCIKVAEDFVSPENVSHCFHLTQEFRYLSDTHSNHEDKLQIKNIMYHAVKDSLSVMGAALSKNTPKAKESSSGAGDSANSAADVKPVVKTEPKSES